MKLLSGSCNEKLSREISRNLKTKLSDIKIITDLAKKKRKISKRNFSLN